METKKVKALSWNRGTNPSVNPIAPHKYYYATRGTLWFRFYTYTAGHACPAETVVHIYNHKDQPAEQRIVVADEKVAIETCNAYLRTFLAKQAAEAAPSENAQRVLDEMIKAMEPTILEAIKRERARELSYAKAFLAVKEKLPKLTLRQWAYDYMGVPRDKVLNASSRHEYKLRQAINATEAQASRYLLCPEKSIHVYLSNYEGAWELSDAAIARLDNDLNTTYRAMLTARLRSAWIGYVPKNVDTLIRLDVSSSPKGFVAEAVLKLEDGQHLLFNTKCIGAGGYNIKCFHYRYITHVKRVAEAPAASKPKATKGKNEQPPKVSSKTAKKPVEIVPVARNKEGELTSVSLPEFASGAVRKPNETEKQFLLRVRRWCYTTRRVHVHGWRSKKRK